MILKYYSALTSFLSALVTFLSVLATDQAITDVAPPAWIYGIGVGISFLTGVMSHLRQAQGAVSAAGRVESIIKDIQNVLEKHATPAPAPAIEAPKEPAPVTPIPEKPAQVTPAPSPAATKIPVLDQILNPVQTATNAVAPVVNEVQDAEKTAQNVLDEITKAINTYKK